MKDIRTLADLTPDPSNANKGTKRGLDLLEKSLERNGIGRSVLVDRNGVLIAGNKTTERVADLAGADVPVVVVRTSGHELVVVQRTDLDVTNPRDPRGRELAIADNRVAEVDLDWDPNVLLRTAQDDTFLDEYFFAEELAAKWGQADADGILTAPRDQVKTPAAEQTVEAEASGPAHDPADEDQRIECPECGHCWEPA